MEIYKYKDEPENEKEELRLINTASWIISQLASEERNSTNGEYVEYRDSEHEKGNEITPWYLWIMDRVNIVLK